MNNIIESGLGHDLMDKINQAVQPLTFDEYQAATNETAVYPSKGELIGLAYTALGLSGEAGEVAEKVKKVIRDDGGAVSLEKRTAIAAEISDVLWYAAQTAQQLGLSLGDIAQSNLDKLRDRKSRGVLGGSGDNR